MESQLHVLFDAETIQNRIKELAKTIDTFYGDKEIVLLIVLKGAFIFAADLCRALSTKHTMEFIRAKSYIGETSSGTMISSGIVAITNVGTNPNLTGKHVLIVEDIVDTGLTLVKLMERLQKENCKSIKVCTLLDKPERREHDINPDFSGFKLKGSPFVLGYGLDVDEYHRDLPYIGVNE